jgi:hypothetical protein
LQIFDILRKRRNQFHNRWNWISIRFYSTSFEGANSISEKGTCD